MNFLPNVCSVMIAFLQKMWVGLVVVLHIETGEGVAMMPRFLDLDP